MLLLIFFFFPFLHAHKQLNRVGEEMKWEGSEGGPQSYEFMYSRKLQIVGLNLIAWDDPLTCLFKSLLSHVLWMSYRYHRCASRRTSRT